MEHVLAEAAKRKLEAAQSAASNPKKAKVERSSSKGVGSGETPAQEKVQGATRLFVGKLPLTVDATSIRELITAAARFGDGSGPGDGSSQPVVAVHWITDKSSGAFYGSVFVQMASAAAAANAAAFFAPEKNASIAAKSKGLNLGKLGDRKLKVSGF